MAAGGVAMLSSTSSSVTSAATHSAVCLRIASALAYAIASFAIVVINKTVLTSYGFPSSQFLGIGQMLVTILVLLIGKKFRIIHYPDYNRDVFKKVWPLPLLYLGNMVCGLGGTKELSLPMFTVLRRFSILMTMIAEFYILGVHSSMGVKLSVGAMVGGALIAASNDLAFDGLGYTYILLNNFFTAAYGVFMKKKLESKELGKYGIMYYNSLFMVLPATVIAVVTGDFNKAINYNGWSNPAFCVQFLMSSIMGFVLIYCTLVCTSYNSALTTTIVGCLKNIFITYIGMYIGGDYIFSMMNFIGLNISVVGSVIYSAITFTNTKPTSATKTNINNLESESAINGKAVILQVT